MAVVEVEVEEVKVKVEVEMVDVARVRRATALAWCKSMSFEMAPR